MLISSLFSILLHAGIDGGINLQSVGVDIVSLTIFLAVLITPSIKRVVLPGNGVNVVLNHVPRWIVRALGLLGHHVAAQEITEVCSNTILMVSHMELQVQGFSGVLIVFLLRNVIGLEHLVEHHITTLQGTVGMTDRVKVGRILTQAYEHRRLGDGKVFGILIKIGIRGSLDTYGIMQEVEVIEIHRHDFILRIVTLQFDGYHPLYGFLQSTLHDAVSLLGV